MAGAPLGNNNGAKGAEWRSAIKRALTRASERLGDGDEIGWRKGLDLAADKFVEATCDGEAWALKELGDRVDGKPKQGVEVSGPEGGPIQAVEWSILPVTPIDETNTEG